MSARLKQVFCIFMTALMAFAMLSELAPLKSDASALDAGLADSSDYEGILLDEADKATKKTTKKKTPKTTTYENPEGAELTYRAYIHGKGWDNEFTEQGKVCGKPGKGLGIEALEIGVKSDIEGSVCCRSYLAGKGWTDQAKNFETCGDTKAKKPMQRIKIYLAGDILVRYRVFYRVCLDTTGWLGWCCDGWVTGNEDYDRAIEAIQVVLVERSGGDVKMTDINGVVSKTGSYYKSAAKIKNYMIRKAQKYTSKTKYLVMVDSQYCFLGIFKGKKNHWELIKFWICAPGIYKTYWNRDHEIGVKSKGFFSYNCQVYWAVRLHKELWIHSITYKGHNGKTVLDGRLGGRYSHGCIRLATENAKWLYDNIPSYSRCICYKKKFL